MDILKVSQDYQEDMLSREVRIAASIRRSYFSKFGYYTCTCICSTQHCCWTPHQHLTYFNFLSFITKYNSGLGLSMVGFLSVK